MKTSQAGINLIKKFEGCRLAAYRDAVGVPTIGYGHTRGVKMGKKITATQAENYLKQDLASFENGVSSLVKVAINQNQFDALVSFSYNLGLGNLKNSDLLKYINAKKFSTAAKEFPLWCHAGGKVLNGLVKRRAAERALFEKGAAKQASTSSKKEYYIVKSGDTLSKIAVKYKTTVSAIDKLNSSIKDVDNIKAGQKIRVK